MAYLYDNEMVSVIIPVYNAGKYIGNTIESALNQTYKKITLVIVDDCSTDKSKNIIDEYIKHNNNIIYHLNSNNTGAAVARNKALEIANGRYVAFLDSDDLWFPEKIQRQLALMSNNNVGFCYTAYEMIDDEGRLIREKIKILEKTEYKHLLKRTMISTPTVLLDRQLIGNVEMPLRRTGQDYAYWLLLLRKIGVAYGIDEALVQVRRRKNSLSKNKIQNVRDVWSIQTKFENIPLLNATYNTICYVCNSFFKRYF